MNQITWKRLNEAITVDPSIVLSEKDILGGHMGYAENEFLNLGLTTGDIQRCIRAGVMYQVRTQNMWFPGDKGPNGEILKGAWLSLQDGSRAPTNTYRGKGSRNTLWVSLEGLQAFTSAQEPAREG